jgi:hypothetical protein
MGRGYLAIEYGVIQKVYRDGEGKMKLVMGAPDVLVYEALMLDPGWGEDELTAQIACLGRTVRERVKWKLGWYEGRAIPQPIPRSVEALEKECFFHASPTAPDDIPLGDQIGPAEACEILNKPDHLVRRMAGRGKLRYITTAGSHRRYSREQCYELRSRETTNEQL